MTEPPPTASRRRRWPFVGVGLLAHVPVALVLYIRWAGDRELAAARAETAAADPGWQLADLLAAREAGMPPPADNPAVLLAGVEVALSRPLRRPALEASGWLKDGAPPNRLPTPAEADDVRAALETVAEPLAVVRRAATLPGGRSPVPMPADPDTFDFTKLPQPQWARAAAYAAVLDAAAAAARNDPPAAVRGVETGLGVARAVGDEPSGDGALVRIAVAAVAARSAERVLGWTEPADGLAELQEAFRREAAEPPAWAALRGERAAFDLTLANVADGRLDGAAADLGDHVGGRLGAFVTRPRWTADHAAGLRLFNRLLADLDKPFHERTPTGRLISDEAAARSGLIATGLLAGSLERVLSACGRHEAQMRCAEVGIACERHRRQAGGWPADLPALVPKLLPVLPLDPFDGKPLRLRRTADGLVVYSVGENRADDGGQPAGKDEAGRPTGDTVFRLFDPAHRRLLALPPAPEPQP